MKPMSFKELIEQVAKGNWIIKKVIYSGKKARIDAETRFYKRGEDNFFSEWGFLEYLNRLRSENGLCPLQDRFAV